jgi:hypothetical protein
MLSSYKSFTNNVVEKDLLYSSFGMLNLYSSTILLSLPFSSSTISSDNVIFYSVKKGKETLKDKEVSNKIIGPILMGFIILYHE